MLNLQSGRAARTAAVHIITKMNLPINELWTLADVPTAAWRAAGCMICLAVALLWLAGRIRRVVRRGRQDDAVAVQNITGFPPLSVIVYAHGDGSTLAGTVDGIYAQDYPAPVEVIVAVDRAYDNTEEVVQQLRSRYPYLRSTFAPLESRNVSRRKLTITLGVKAATYDTVVVTAGNCRMDSPLWLRRMARHVAAGHTVVAGHSVAVPKTEAVRRAGAFTRFDTLRDCVRWLAPAVDGRVLRSSGCNVVYTRSAFFDNNGFASSLGLNYGDDDILVSELAADGSATVELGAGARLDELELNPAGAMRLGRLHHDCTSRRLPSAPRLWFGFIDLLWWAFIACLGLTLWLSWPHLAVMIAAVLLFVGITAWYAVQWRNAGRALGLRVNPWGVPWLMWTHPLVALWIKIAALRNRRDNYTWHNNK